MDGNGEEENWGDLGLVGHWKTRCRKIEESPTTLFFLNFVVFSLSFCFIWIEESLLSKTENEKLFHKMKKI